MFAFELVLALISPVLSVLGPGVIGAWEYRHDSCAGKLESRDARVGELIVCCEHPIVLGSHTWT